MASAGAVDISGEIGGDARVAAGQTTVSGSIGEDLFIASGQTTISDAGEVGEDLVFGSGRMTMNGTVGGDVLGAAGDYDRQGTVAGTENVTIREVEAPTTTDRIVDALQRLISLLLVAALFLWLRPQVRRGAHPHAEAEALGVARRRFRRRDRVRCRGLPRDPGGGAPGHRACARWTQRSSRQRSCSRLWSRS